MTEEDEFSRPGSPVYSTGPGTLGVPSNVDSVRSSLITLISALDQELQVPPSATSEVTLFDFDPSLDGIAKSTPPEPKTQAKRHSRNSEAAPPLPALSTTSSRRSSIVYIKSDEHAAPSPSPSTLDRTGRSSPVVRPLAPKPKSSKVRAKKADQENVAPAPKGLRQLSLLQDRNQSRTALPETKPLSLSKSAKKASAQDAAGENVHRDPSLRRALRPLKLGRSETTKQRAILRDTEVLPDVVVRPPSDGQHIGFSYSFR